MSMGMFFWVKKVTPFVVVAIDGSGDFTDIQTAIDTLPASGGTVYIKPGDYTITATITIPSDNVTLMGSGRSTKIIATTNIHLISIDPGTTTNGSRISSLYIYGNNTRFGIYIVEVTKLTVDDVTIENCAAGIFMSHIASARNTINNCHILNNAGRGIWIQDTSYQTVTSNIVTGNGGSGIEIGGGTQPCESILIRGNSCLSNGAYGVDLLVEAERCIITENTLLLNTTAPLRDLGVDNQIGHNITS